ncbi:2301_t:CDS:1, partial [Gigaspora rosea]
IEDRDQNYDYIQELEDLLNVVEATGVKDAFSDLTKCTTLLKLQLNPELSTMLNTFTVSFTFGGSITFENSRNSLTLKSNSTPPH